MTVFNIKESDWTEEFYSIYDDIKADFVSGMKIMDIKAKYGLNHNRWRKYRKEMIEDGTYDKRPKHEPRYITRNKNDDSWRVIKSTNRKTQTLLWFKEEKKAIRAVELFKKYGWDIENRERIKKEVNEMGEM